MSEFTTSTNMSMPVPNVGIAGAPNWASLLDTCLGIIDSHSHVQGSGVPITPSAININADLTFAAYNATNLRTARFSAQSAALVLASDLGCLYNVSGDLYYNDGAGNQIRLTQSGSIVGTAGSITGLPSGTAGVSYTGAGATYVFQSATNVAAILDARNLILRNSSASSFGLTLQPPAGMAGNFAITLPALPASTLPVSISSAGAMSAAALTNSQRAALGQTVSSSSGAISTSSTTFALMTNQTAAITSTGRPAWVSLMPELGTTNPSNIQLPASSDGQIRFKRNGTVITTFLLDNSNASSIRIPPGGFCIMDTGASAGTNTYTAEWKVATTGTISANYVQLAAYEL